MRGVVVRSFSILLYTIVFCTGSISAQGLWYRAYDSGSRGPDQFLDVAVASNGDVAVTGRSRANTEYDYITIRYDANGNQRFLARYNNSAQNFIDEAHFVAVDQQGNTYVTGFSYGGTATGYDYHTIKYGPSGQVLWQRRYNSPDNRYDSPEAMEVDAAGNVHICGYSFRTGGLSVLQVMKYDTNGNILWQHDLKPAAASSAGCRGLALDAVGNTYVTGIATGQVDDVVIAKVSPTGQVAYNVTYSTKNDEAGHGIVADAQGNAIVTGQGDIVVGQMIETHTMTLKLGPSGQLVWARYKVFGSNTASLGTVVAVDAAGNSYAAGFLGDMGGNDGTLVSYSPSGQERWSYVYDEPADFDDQQFTKVVVGGDGNIYVNAMTEFPLPAGYDFTVFRFAPAGTLIDKKHYDTGSHTDVADVAFTLDDTDNIYFAGFSWSDLTKGDAAVLKVGTLSTGAAACPASPSITSATEPNKGTARVAWKDLTTTESGYELERASYVGSSWSAPTLLPRQPAGSTSFSETLPAGQYRYRLRAVGAGCSSSWTVFKIVKPGAPSQVTAVASGIVVSLNWADNSAFESSFQVQRQKLVNGTWSSTVAVLSTAKDARSAQDSPGAGNWRYRVVARNTAGSSASAWVQVTVR